MFRETTRPGRSDIIFRIWKRSESTLFDTRNAIITISRFFGGKNEPCPGVYNVVYNRFQFYNANSDRNSRAIKASQFRREINIMIDRRWN